jgi:hypothetical protein
MSSLQTGAFLALVGGVGAWLSFAAVLVVDYLDHDDAFARNGAAEVLQNTGFLERLALAARKKPDGFGARLLERVYRAGAERLACAAEDRVRTVAPDHRRVA